LAQNSTCLLILQPPLSTLFNFVSFVSRNRGFVENSLAQGESQSRTKDASHLVVVAATSRIGQEV
jgi:hypothetical protein